jgi:CubicO group peptidase (beta-lactamase class C family)
MDRKTHSTCAFALTSAAIIGLAGVLMTQPPSRAETAPSPEERVDELFKRFHNDTPGCAVAVMQDGKIIFKRGYGLADLDHGIAITPSTVFHAASLAKQFTAMSIMMLVRQGKLSLEDDVKTIVPELTVKKPVSVGDILRHISGIRDEYTLFTMKGWRLYDDLVTQKDVVNLVSQMESQDFEPRTDLMYSNTNYSLAAMIIKNKTGKSLTEFAQENIFKKLRMDNTSIIDNHAQIIKNRALGYWQRDKDQPYEVLMPNLDITGPTNLQTTIEDLALWEANFIDKTVGGDYALIPMQTPAVLSNGKNAELGPNVYYGLGLQLTKYNTLDIVEHDGRDAGFRAHFIRFPAQRFAVACLCNFALPENYLPRKIVRRIADIYLAGHFPAPMLAEDEAEPLRVTESVAGRADLSEYMGSYYSKEIDTAYQIVVKGSSIAIKRSKYDDTLLTPVTSGPADDFSYQGFSRPLATGTVRFMRTKGKIDGFEMSGKNAGGGERLRNFRFTRQ